MHEYYNKHCDFKKLEITRHSLFRDSQKISTCRRTISACGEVDINQSVTSLSRGEEATVFCMKSRREAAINEDLQNPICDALPFQV